MLTDFNKTKRQFNPEMFSLVLKRVTRMKVWIFQNNWSKYSSLPILKKEDLLTKTSWDRVPTFKSENVNIQ